MIRRLLARVNRLLSHLALCSVHTHTHERSIYPNKALHNAIMHFPERAEIEERNVSKRKIPTFAIVTE